VASSVTSPISFELSGWPSLSSSVITTVEAKLLIAGGASCSGATRSGRNLTRTLGRDFGATPGGWLLFFASFHVETG
jgi:hypothetical protein